MRTLVINDLHLGVQRQAGTTKESRLALENWMLNRFHSLLYTIPHDELLILGDLFDSRNVEEHVMADVIATLSYKKKITLVLGNHDLGGGGEEHKMSSAEFVGNIIGATVISEPTLHNGMWIIPHLHSQTEFDLAVSQCPEKVKMLTHCNIDSPWTHGDSSLNLSLQQIADLNTKHVQVIAAHEHAQRMYMNNVIVIGNQFPSSILDCQSGPKRCLLIEGERIESHTTWDAGNYAKVASLADVPITADFIEVVGHKSVAEFVLHMKDIATFRKTSRAFIIKNSNTAAGVERPEEQDEAVTRFNIIEMLLNYLPEDVRKEVQKCLSQE